MVRVWTGAGVMAPGSSDDQLGLGNGPCVDWRGVMAPGSSDDQPELGNGPCADWGRCYGAWKQ